MNPVQTGGDPGARVGVQGWKGDEGDARAGWYRFFSSLSRPPRRGRSVTEILVGHGAADGSAFTHSLSA